MPATFFVKLSIIIATSFSLAGRLMIQNESHSKHPLTESEEKKLIRLAKRGDFDAFETLYHEFFNLVYNRVWHQVPRHDAEDVTQEIFTAAVKSLKNFRGDSKFSTWLRTLTNRQIANYYRTRSRSDAEVDIDLEDIEYGKILQGSTSPTPTEVDDTIQLHQALQDLPEHYRDILLLRFADGLKFKEIAKSQGKTVEATKSMFRRAISALQTQLGDTNG